MSKPTKFERGQLILAPWKDGHVLWAVVSVAKSGKAKLIAHLGSLIMEVTTTVDVLPDDWALITNDQAVKALQARPVLSGGASSRRQAFTDA